MSNSKLFHYCSEKSDFSANNKKAKELLEKKVNINVMYHEGICFIYSAKHSNLELLKILINHYKSQIKWEQGSDEYMQELQKLADVLGKAEDYSDKDSESGSEIIKVIHSIIEEAYPSDEEESSEDSREHDFDGIDKAAKWAIQRVMDALGYDESHRNDIEIMMNNAVNNKYQENEIVNVTEKYKYAQDRLEFMSNFPKELFDKVKYKSHRFIKSVNERSEKINNDIDTVRNMMLSYLNVAELREKIELKYERDKEGLLTKQFNVLALDKTVDSVDDLYSEDPYDEVLYTLSEENDDIYYIVGPDQFVQEEYYQPLGITLPEVLEAC